MSQSLSKNVLIRLFQSEDMPLLGELYQSVTINKHAVFWWVGDEANWCNVYCAFEQGKMIAKGQVSIINVVPPNRSQENKHSIYVNLKTVPDRENDVALLETIYQQLFRRANELMNELPKEYGTILCVGNDSSEAANNQFFIDKGYRNLYRSYHMNRDLKEPISELKLPEEFQFSHWKMETADEEREYLAIEGEIWPDTPLGHNRLCEHKTNKLWTAMVIRYKGIIVGGLMAWQEQDYGVIEDVFVREPWRKRGIAKYLLTEALTYLKANGLQNAALMVVTTNQSALTLYESVGFHSVSEELRYCIHLN